jgi:hypothetical protein
MPNEFHQGQHICALYDTADEQRAVAAQYLADGLRRGERGLYVADSRAALEQFRGALRVVGIDADAGVGAGALIEGTRDEVHLLGGHFDCERMLRLLNDAVESALNDGFTGLRTCGDMSWLLDAAPGSDQVVEYEALLNQFFQGVRAAGMCQYDRRRLSANMIDHALATHSTATIDGQHKVNPFYQPPSIAASRTAQPVDVPWKLSELRRRH